LILGIIVLGVAIGVAVSRPDILGDRWQDSAMHSHLKAIANDAYVYRTQHVRRGHDGLLVQRDLYIGYRIPEEIATDDIATYKIVGRPGVDKVSFIGTLRKDVHQTEVCTVDKNGEVIFRSSQ